MSFQQHLWLLVCHMCGFWCVFILNLFKIFTSKNNVDFGSDGHLFNSVFEQVHICYTAEMQKPQFESDLRPLYV